MFDIAVFALATLAALLLLAYFQAPILAWTLASGVLLASWAAAFEWSGTANGIVLGCFVVLGAILNVNPLRRKIVSDHVLAMFRRILPDMSQTEKEAIDAGTVWWDADLFSGKPDWNKLLAIPQPKLSAEEQAFLDGPCEEVCSMTDDWDVTHERYDLSPQVWQYVKDQGFLGMIIPKKYGGLGFSALAHSAVVLKLATRSNALSVSVMVPNSLGPAELLLHYGTEEQKNHYLPRLARGLEVPCFALTSPEAGSDAASIPDYGVVCKGQWQGKETLGMRVTWDKRYITLGPVATLLGLAFRLYDPERLLGTKEDLGITCALVATNTPGVNIGRRHLPLNAVFQNGPNSGKDVFMPIDWIIGGKEYAGKGWKMLMGCLAAGRSISLPTSSVGGAKSLARVTGAYARVRSQFKTPIGKLEGVEEALGRIAANCYMMDAVRIMTAGAVDLGEKPAVISAIAKYHMTERARKIVDDSMDIHGGKGICLGPNNWVGRGYQVIPVGITVEGANILTRTLIIFGQGAIRCHPYVLREMRAAKEMQGAAASIEFDDAFTSHIGHTLSNGVRAFVHGITSSRLGQVPRGGAPETKHYYRFTSRLAAAFAFLADVSMLAMGGALKRKEKISGRLGDVLSMLYLVSATLKHYEDQGRNREDVPLIRWVVRDALYQAQQAIDAILSNFPVKSLATLLRWTIFPLGMSFRPPLDSRNRECAQMLLEPGASRDRLTAGMYVGKGEVDPTGILEAAFLATIACEPIDEKLRKAVKKGKIVPQPGVDLGSLGIQNKIITAEEFALWRRKEALRRNVIKVDDFPQDFGRAEILAKLAQETHPAAKAA
ncbi:MAG: acyl-CoA dehydrogenase [Betaproteobacteria bacterium RBG_16_66_20]|nr:MAG: acyl-CoA dehydrogenase [Betaproteobacteria bacterium RBG_16_66_20]